MGLKVEILSALEDNYIYFLTDEETKKTAVVDPSEAAPVITFLKARKISLNYIFNTHHHWDHTGGNLELVKKTNCQVVGAENDAHRIPAIHIRLKEGDTFELGATQFHIMEVPGHTLGAIIFFCDENKVLFTGDTLFSLGCGRLFEGSPEQMFRSLQKIKSLPLQTLIYCGHEYTQKNCEFALSLDPKNSELLEFQKALRIKREEKLPSIPSTLQLELRLNPFLKCDQKRFTEIRKLKDGF